MKTCIIITGPTAAGKTSIALRLAKHFETGIISADSRQCYKEMSIGVAKPSKEELQSIPHYFINSHSIHDEVTVKIFERYALEQAENIFRDHNQLIMAGGTGLYIKAFCEGIDQIPGIPPSVRENVNLNYDRFGLQWLQEELQKEDPLYFATGETQNPHRMLRALEVKLATGKSIRQYQTNQKLTRDFNILKIGIELERQELYHNINTRVDQMIEQGLLEEVTALSNFREQKALQTVGYSEIFDFLDGRFSLNDAIGEIKKNTRRYAKRQLTWFKRDEEINWFKAYEYDSILSYIESRLEGGKL